MSPSFGKQLRKYRDLCSHPQSGHRLTQERLAERMNVAVSTIHNWEKDRRHISAEERHTLLTLLGILHTWGGLCTQQETNDLLYAGGYRKIDDDEIERYLPNLGIDQTKRVEVEKQGEEGKDMSTMPTPHTLTKSTMTALFSSPDWPEDESRVAKIVLHLLGYPFDNFSVGQGMRLIAIVIIWAFSVAIWSQALAWPFFAQTNMIQAWTLWAGMAVSVPLLLGLLIKADRQDILTATTKAKGSIALIRITGALAGYLIGAALVLLVILGMFYLEIWPAARWLTATLAGIPLLISYSAGKRMPLNHYRAFSLQRGGKNAFRLEEGDWVMFCLFLMLGPVLAGLFIIGQPWSWHPLLGISILGLAFLGAGALQIWSRRMGEQVIPAWVWALLVGIPLGLQMATQPGAEPLLGIGLMAGLLALAADLRRQTVPPRLIQLVGFLGILVGIWALLQVNVWMGRVMALIGAGVAWRWLRELFWQMARFWLVFGILLVSLVLLVATEIPPWLVRISFGGAAVTIILWRENNGDHVPPSQR